MHLPSQYLKLAAIGIMVSTPTFAAQHTRFWNLTGETIVSLKLAPTGTSTWSDNQCDNDKDKAVQHDERLELKGISPGQYDVSFEVSGRACLIRNIEVTGDSGYAFSLDTKDLAKCKPVSKNTVPK